MACNLPAHLYIRVDRDLRSALHERAAAAGLNVSAFARRELRDAVSRSNTPGIHHTTVQTRD